MSEARARLRQLHAAEAAALDAWRHACADYDQAVAVRARAVARTQRRLDRAMRPLSQRRCARLERAYAAQDVVTVAGYTPLVGNVGSYLDRVRAASTTLSEVTRERDARVEVARRVRAASAARLLALPALSSSLVGVSRQQLGTIARDLFEE